MTWSKIGLHESPRKNLWFEIHFTHLYFRFHRIWQNCRFASWILGYTSLRFWFHKSAKVTFIERISREAPPLVFLVFIFCPCTRTLVTFQDGLEIFLCQQAWALEFSFFFSHLFRHSWLLLFLTEHYQHEKGFTNKISAYKSIGAPYLVPVQ